MIEELAGDARQVRAERAVRGSVSTDLGFLAGAKGLESARPSSSPEHYFLAKV